MALETSTLTDTLKFIGGTPGDLLEVATKTQFCRLTGWENLKKLAKTSEGGLWRSKSLVHLGNSYQMLEGSALICLKSRRNYRPSGNVQNIVLLRLETSSVSQMGTSFSPKSAHRP